MASLVGYNCGLHSYTRLLSAQLHVYRPYEAMLKQYQHVVQPTQSCSKAPLDAQVAPLRDYPAWMLGVMYVFEGATLGGAVIRQQLMRTIE